MGRGCGDVHTTVLRNRERVCAALGFERFETPRQVHGDAVVAVDGPAPVEGCDGLIVSRPGLLAGVLGADCPGVLLVAPARRVLAVVHAGWRGVAAGIVPRALGLLSTDHGVEPGALRVGIGPGIAAARYEVSAEVADAIRAALPPAVHREVVQAGRRGHAHVDLQAAIRAQLVAGGVAAASIETHPACTYDDERFFSHRRDAGTTGRHALVAGWR